MVSPADAHSFPCPLGNTGAASSLLLPLSLPPCAFHLSPAAFQSTLDMSAESKDASLQLNASTEFPRPGPGGRGDTCNPLASRMSRNSLPAPRVRLRLQRIHKTQPVSSGIYSVFAEKDTQMQHPRHREQHQLTRFLKMPGACSEGLGAGIGVKFEALHGERTGVGDQACGTCSETTEETSGQEWRMPPEEE